MGERHRHHGGGLGFHRLALRQQQLPPRPPPPRKRAEPRPRIGPLRSAGGEIMEIQGGRIVRATGRKDRHSKVCTAKGPRDRRVRLAAHTAIQFYDVQDRLGYDRPSKAVDWLIQNAKAAIDQLAELPRRTPAAAANSTSCAPPRSSLFPAATVAAKLPSSESDELSIASTAFAFGDGGDGGANFLPPSLDSDAIADTIKSFFPMAAAASAAASPPDLQDLRLSLQSFQDPISHNSLLASSSHLGFDAIAGGWATEQSQRMAPWNVAEASGGSGGFEGFAFDVPPPEAVPLHAMLGPSQLFAQRGPLQSSNPLSARGWPAELQMYPAALQHSVSSMGFVSKAGFSGFRMPARIQGEEEEDEDDGASDKPPSASRH